MIRALSYSDALQQSKDNEHADWSVQWQNCEKAKDYPEHAANRIHDGYAKPVDTFDAVFTREDNLFCVGSCFARSIEHALQSKGLHPSVLTRFAVETVRHPTFFTKPPIETGRPFDFTNRFNVPSMLQLIEDITNDNPIGDRLLYNRRDGTYHDFHYTWYLSPLTLEESMERRKVILDNYREAFEEATGFVFTFGLCEAFRDVDADLYLNVTPDPRSAQNRNIEWNFLGFGKTVHSIQMIIHRIRQKKPYAPIIFTVSPVPLDRTFSGMDIISANALAKATLLTATHAAMDGAANCFYFPSYEAVMHSRPDIAWMWDKKHVDLGMVDSVIGRFVAKHASVSV